MYMQLEINIVFTRLRNELDDVTEDLYSFFTVRKENLKIYKDETKKHSSTAKYFKSSWLVVAYWLFNLLMHIYLLHRSQSFLTKKVYRPTKFYLHKPVISYSLRTGLANLIANLYNVKEHIVVVISILLVDTRTVITII